MWQYVTQAESQTTAWNVFPESKNPVEAAR